MELMTAGFEAAVSQDGTLMGCLDGLDVWDAHQKNGGWVERGENWGSWVPCFFCNILIFRSYMGQKLLEWNMMRLCWILGIWDSSVVAGHGEFSIAFGWKPPGGISDLHHPSSDIFCIFSIPSSSSSPPSPSSSSSSSLSSLLSFFLIHFYVWSRSSIYIIQCGPPSYKLV